MATNKSKEALKLALDALELNNDEWKSLADSGDCGYWNAEDQDHYKQTNEAITAIKQARSAPVQEPVANASTWFALVMNAAAELEDASHCLRDEDAKRVAISGAKHYRDAANALYTTPPAQEFVCSTGLCHYRKPLTNEQVGKAARDAHIAFCLNKHKTYEHALTRAVEAAHGITGETK